MRAACLLHHPEGANLGARHLTISTAGVTPGVERSIADALGEELGVTRYADSRGRPKSVRYFAMRPLAGAFRPHDEVDEIAWLPTEAIRTKLTYERDHSLVEGVQEPVPPLAFVRHATAGHRHRWEHDDNWRPFDERGRIGCSREGSR